MELQTAREIIDTLAQGIHPVTGEAMPEDSPYNAPPVIRALLAVSQALEGGTVARPRRPRGELPPNTGKPWSEGDDEQLRMGFDAGTPTKDLAAALGRTRWAVESRLVKLGAMPLARGGAPLNGGGH